jgi:hypothetical protein
VSIHFFFAEATQTGDLRLRIAFSLPQQPQQNVPLCTSYFVFLKPAGQSVCRIQGFDVMDVQQMMPGGCALPCRSTRRAGPLPECSINCSTSQPQELWIVNLTFRIFKVPMWSWQIRFSSWRCRPAFRSERFPKQCNANANATSSMLTIDRPAHPAATSLSSDPVA